MGAMNFAAGSRDGVDVTAPSNRDDYGSFLMRTRRHRAEEEKKQELPKIRTFRSAQKPPNSSQEDAELLNGILKRNAKRRKKAASRLLASKLEIQIALFRTD